eukprot:gnl/Chilomastix_cuspidata/103.p2 GENE.gnl/Chilomastix_cuspidata/103~~gnl/Chilomastix_cuspidata/103.p2  ORF type:complete len:591 (-),score=259.87 gnl/Chilomastix_cuspidata/103:3846-5543(-)
MEGSATSDAAEGAPSTSLSDSYSTVTESGAYESSVVHMTHMPRSQTHQDIYYDIDKSTIISACGEHSSDHEYSLHHYSIIRPGMRQYIGIPLALVFLFVILFVPMMSDEDAAAQRCLALLLCASTLWASEAIPLFVTSMIIPVLVVLLDVLLDEGGVPLDTASAADTVVKKMLSTTIFLVVAGFTIAAALSKYQLDSYVADKALGMAARKSPMVYVLVIMVLGFVLSMFVSNVTVPVLLLSFTKPQLDALPADSPFLQTVFAAIMVSCNIGGVTTPISSPQNAVAMQTAEEFGIAINFGNFVLVSIPTGVVSLAIGFVLVFFVMFRPGLRSLPPVAAHDEAAPGAERPRLPRAGLVSIVLTIVFSAVGIVLWVTMSVSEPIFGNTGIVSIIIIVLFYGTGLLTAREFCEKIPWQVIFLLLGGSALGEAVKSSELLDLTTTFLQHMAAWSPWLISLVICFLIGIVATFISHTVSAIILLPILAAFAQTVADLNDSMLLMVSALMCSGAMGLPVSSFPNISVTSVTNAAGAPIFSVANLLKIGWPMTVINALVAASFGYFLSIAVFA